MANQETAEGAETSKGGADGTARVFVAIELTDSVQAALAGWIRDLRSAGAKVSWVRERNLHLTLVFLGEISSKRVVAVGRIQDEEAVATPVFDVAVRGTGCFGSTQYPRVVWAGVEAPVNLADVQRRLTNRLKAKGFEVDGRAYQPHITVGRVRGREGVAALTSVVASANNIDFGKVTVRRLVLKQSLLGPEGAEYSTRWASGLKEG